MPGRVTVQVDDIARALAVVLLGKALVIGGMPVLGSHHQVERGHHAVGYLDDLVALRNREVSAGQEVVLNIDEDE